MSTKIPDPINQHTQEIVEQDKKNKNKKYLVHDVDTQSILIQDVGQISKKKKKKYKKISCVSACFLVVGLLLVLLLPFILEKIVISIAIKKSVLSKDNQQFWAHFPGGSGTIITRNFTFFNFTNEQAFFLYGQKPKLRQIQGYIITELEDYLDIVYLQDSNKVKMRDWLHFEIHNDSKSLQEKVNILNIPSLGYWYMLKNSRDALLFIQAFSTLFTSIQDQIVDSIISQGISTQYLSNFTVAYTSFFSVAVIPKNNSQDLWNDPAFGFSDQGHIKQWVIAAKKSFTNQSSPFSKEATDLQNYFGLTDSQLYLILEQINQYAESLENLILTNYYCLNISSCDGRQLAIRQIAESYVTLYPPPVSNISAEPTICSTNDTCKDYFPQLFAFYKQVYLPKHKQANQSLTFPVQTVRKWLDYNPSRKKGQYNKNQSALFHIGNLDALFTNGTMHDKTKSSHYSVTDYLENIRNRFQIDSNNSTIVFWQWIKYLMSQVFRQNTQKNQILGIANSFSGGMYTAFTFLQDNLLSHLLKAMIKNKLTQMSCDTLIKNTLQTNNDTLISNVCNRYGHDITSDIFVHDSVETCRQKYGNQWKKFKLMGISKLQMESFCDPSNKDGFGQLFQNMTKQINDFYRCNYSHNSHCSDYELALKQWANSSVTLRQPSSAGQVLKSSTTFKDWNSSAQAFQYYHYGQKFSQKVFPIINITQAYRLFNFDNIFSATSNLKVFKSAETKIEWKDYMRYIVVFIAFRGLNYARTTKQFIFGYNDQYLEWRKNNYPPFGGDPSTPAFLSFNDPNITEDQAVLELQWYTGKNDYRMTSQYYTINNRTYLNLNYTYFNGNETYSVLQSPWAENDYFYGTSGKSFAPNQQATQNVSIYVPNLQRYGSGGLAQSQPTSRYDYDLKIFYLGQSIYKTGQQYPPNKKYYQNFEAVFNQTSVLGFPFFVTKHHFMNCTSNWSKLVDTYNHNETIKYQATSYWDDSYVIVEPYSGVAFQATINIQANYFYEPDQLFPQSTTMMIPVFSIYRSGNVTEDKANELFSSLHTVKTLQTVSFYVGIVFAACGFLCLVFSLIKIKYILNKVGKINQSMKISLQPRKQHEQHEKNQIDHNEKLNSQIHQPLIK